LPHILKVIEKAIKAKSEEIGNNLFKVGNYQVGF